MIARMVIRSLAFLGGYRLYRSSRHGQIRIEMKKATPPKTNVDDQAGIEFREGEVYYRLTFPDATMFYPKVETFVFIGKNLSDDDEGDIWYFQFADSYATFGSILRSKGGDRRVALVTRRDLADMLDLAGLTRELEMAATRRRMR